MTGFLRSDIFTQFHKVESNKTKVYRGTGLGLAICKEIIKAHGGKIWAENNEGPGITVHFILPQNH